MTTLRDGIHSIARRIASTVASAWQRNRQHQKWQELDEAGRESRLRDLGLGWADTPLFWSDGSSVTDLLPRMMAVNGVDHMSFLEVGNGVKRDLERVCSLCPHKARCARVLNGSPDPEACAFCPNAGTLDALSSH